MGVNTKGIASEEEDAETEKEQNGDFNESLIEKFVKTPDELDALPPQLRYNNFDLSCTIISISTYLFDLVS